MTAKGIISNDRTSAVTSSLVSHPRIVNLQQLTALNLEPLLQEETAEWRTRLDWDFSQSVDLVRKFAAKGWLHGAALIEGGEVSGYGYTGVEGRNASIWDVYVRRARRSRATEPLLLRALFDTLIDTGVVDRIESQLMLVEAASAHALRQHHLVRLFERLLMTFEADAPLPLARTSLGAAFHLDRWTNNAYDSAGCVMALAYSGHIDAAIHQHYRLKEEASRFIYNLVHFPGCATFHRSASYLAFDRVTGQVAGISLSMFIAEDVAHVAELCVVPQFQGIGLGYELLRRSVESLRQAGARRISVTVTAANQAAVHLYTCFGFRETHRFYAYVWERVSTS